ncbi:MAG TPA: diiron oxygenase [Sphingomicrobium sp.]|jgi:hypothetical protein|nr:diiron oxygenase [Sphingomicrobium sp.]
MYHGFTYESVLLSSLRAQWELDDVLRVDQELDFTRKFMPDLLARTDTAPGLTPAEQLKLNYISAHQYLYYFGVVEQFILPFVLDHARPMLNEDDFRVRALLNFANEEAKHVHLFRRFKESFDRGFPVTCPMLGPPGKLQQKVLSHHPLAVGLIVLMIEWMTQEHYLGSIRKEEDLDPLFKSLLKHHWMEEAQHAKLDTLMVDALAEGRSEREITFVIDEFFQIVGYLDASLKRQAVLNLDALQRSIRRPVANSGRLIAQQYAAARWTYLGSAITHPRFRASLDSISPNAAARVANAVKQAAIEPLEEK